jgi:hypothetical protein
MRTCGWCSGVLVFVLVIGSGCGGKDRPVKVIGVVTLDGNPVGNASVTFSPVEEKGTPATALTDSAGNFRLSTVTEEGALPGEYKVVVVKYPETFQKGRAGMQSTLPAIYSSAATSPLTCKVPPEGKVILELHGQGK